VPDGPGGLCRFTAVSPDLVEEANRRADVRVHSHLARPVRRAREASARAAIALRGRGRTEMTTTPEMSVEETRAVMERYVNSEHGDVSMMAADVVFRVMATGDEHRTPAGVIAMLAYFYHGAFEATAVTRKSVVGPGSAVLEADFVGRHIGEFAGVPATGRDVRVPLCVCYDLRDGKIVEGRIYFEIPAFLAQVSAPR
jgi:predicted ester cyclase